MQFCTTSRGKSRESGYILIIFLMVLTLMMLALTAALPRLAQQIKRDREIDMVHRGDQYARAIKRYYKKFGRYPGRIEDLEKSNNIRFLRKRYTDPMSKDGAWRLVRYGEVQLGTGGPGAAGVSAAQLAQSAASSQGAKAGGMFNLNLSGSAAAAGSANPAVTAILGLAAGSATAAAGATTPQATGTTADSSGTATTSNSGTTPQTSPGQTTATSGGGMFSSPASSAQPGAGGGGAIIGVASLNKKTGIHVFAKKTAYNEWLFLYDPAQDRGQLLRGPYDPKAYFGQFSSQTIGKPIAGPQGSQPSTGAGQPTGTGSGVMSGTFTPMGQPSNTPGAAISPGATNTPTPQQ